MGLLDGKVALVTGGGKGIGRAVAHMFVAEGARVAVTGRTLSDVRRVAEEIGSKAVAIEHDVTKRADWKNAIGYVKDWGGRLDVLVNNAGVVVGASFLEATDENWQLHMSFAHAIFMGCQEALPLMKQGGRGGSIINVLSSWGQRPVPGFVSYCSSRATAAMTTKVLALECAADRNPIRVNSVHPGITATDMTWNAVDKMSAETGCSKEEALTAFLSFNPIKRMAEPEEIAAAVLYLASDAAALVTGIELNVDGGSLIRP